METTKQTSRKAIVFNTAMIWIMLLGIMLVLIFKDFSPTVNCGDNESAAQAPISIILTQQDTTSADGKTGTIVRATATSAPAAPAQTIIWNNCPEQPTAKPAVKTAKTEAAVKKTTTAAPVANEATQKMASEKTEETTKSEEMNVTIIEQPTAALEPDTIRVEVTKTTNDEEEQLFYHESVRQLPLTLQGMLRDEGAFHYDFQEDFSKQIAAWNAQQRKAKKHLIIDTSLVGLSALGYTATELMEIPTLVEWNGLAPLDPANKYYDHNVQQDKNLRTLRWTRAGIIAVGAVGGFEIVRGICLLKPITLDVAPTKLTFRYTF